MDHFTDDIHVEIQDFVAVVEFRRPPHNFFDVGLIVALAETFEALDLDDRCRALVLASAGKSFCAGGDFSLRSPLASKGATSSSGGSSASDLYAAGARLFATRKPIVGAIQGPAIGGGLGLALVPDFRVVAPEARFSANFVKIGIHPGFGLTYTLPQVIGTQRAARMFYTGYRIDAEQALAWGLADEMAPTDQLRSAAIALAAEIAAAAPLAVVSTRATLRQDLIEVFKAQTAHEAAEQAKLFATKDFREGVRAVAERRPGVFVNA